MIKCERDGCEFHVEYLVLHDEGSWSERVCEDHKPDIHIVWDPFGDNRITGLPVVKRIVHYIGICNRMAGSPPVHVGPFECVDDVGEWSMMTGVRVSIHPIYDPEDVDYGAGAEVWS